METRPRSLAAAFACAALGTSVAAFAAPALARPARFPIAWPAKAVNRPDFKITKISVTGLPGRPGYMVLNQHGIAPGFTVKVTTKNIGDATKKTSETALIFTSGDRVYSLQLAKVPARGHAGLAHNETYTSTFKVDSLSPPLGRSYRCQVRVRLIPKPGLPHMMVVETIGRGCAVSARSARREL